jgi:hypothetical protein
MRHFISGIAPHVKTRVRTEAAFRRDIDAAFVAIQNRESRFKNARTGLVQMWQSVDFENRKRGRWTLAGRVMWRLVGIVGPEQIPIAIWLKGGRHERPRSELRTASRKLKKQFPAIFTTCQNRK